MKIIKPQVHFIIKIFLDRKWIKTPNGIVLVSLLLSLNKFHTLFINFEQVNAGWDLEHIDRKKLYSIMHIRSLLMIINDFGRMSDLCSQTKAAFGPVWSHQEMMKSFKTKKLLPKHCFLGIRFPYLNISQNSSIARKPFNSGFYNTT